MTVRQKVEDAASPLDALLAIADAVDELVRDKYVAPDPWAGWGEQTSTRSTTTPTFNKPAVEAEIADLQEELAGCEDPKESAVLRAKLALAADKLVEHPRPAEEALEQARTIQVTDGGDVMVEVPVPDAETIARREALLSGQFGEAMVDQYGEDGPTFGDSFLKAGPLLLYYSDRDFINGLPDHLKHELVEDVEHFSPNEAAEMARDILKDATPGAERLEILQEANINATDGAHA